jgi:type I restriction enzyme S subunit
MNFRKVKISDFCLVTDYVANGSFKSLKNNVEYLYDDGYAILVRLTDFTKNWNNNYRYVSKKSYDFLKHSKLHPGDLIMSNVGEPGRVFLLPDLGKPMTLGPNSILIRPDRTKASSFYMKYYFESQFGQNQILQITSGAAQKKFNKTSFRSLLINLPSLSIQQKIVEKLDRIFAEIYKATAAAEANVKNAVVIFYSVLNKLLDENKLGWNSLQLKEACTFINRGISPSYLDNDEGILILNQKCVRNHKIAYDLGRRHDVLRKKVKEEKLIRYGDVLVNSTGTGTLGRIAQVVDEILQPITVDTHVTIVRPNLNRLSANFFGFMMIQIEEDIKKAGEGSVGQTELSRTTLSEKFKVVFPNDKKLQKSLYLQLSSVKENSSKFKNLMEIKIKELNLLKQAVLKKAFNGELVKAA